MANLLIQGAVTAGLGLLYQALAPDQKFTNEGQRLEDPRISTGDEGTPITRGWGSMRVGGHLLWASALTETKNVTTESQGGKGGPTVTTTNIEYVYTQSLAFGFIEADGDVTLRKVWFNNEVIDLSKYTYRFYDGSSAQAPDTHIEGIEGHAPGYRGLCYIVFEDVDLSVWGNAIPQIQAELHRASEQGSLEQKVKAVNLMTAQGGPGGSLAVTETISEDDGASTTININQKSGQVDLLQSLDDLTSQFPNLEHINLLVPWFGDDLRCNVCTIKPKVVSNTAVQNPAWTVSGLAQSAAEEVSTLGTGLASYGGTPSDAEVIEAIKEIKGRGLKVTLSPVVLMDIPVGNTKTDPYTGAEGQQEYPSRRLITCYPGPDDTGTPDQTSEAGTQVDTFFGTSTASDAVSGGVDLPPTWAGSASDWSYKRMAYHYARLGIDVSTGIDAYMLGTELGGLTKVRSGTYGPFPAVDQLATIAAQTQALDPQTSDPTPTLGDGQKRNDGIVATTNIYPVSIDQWTLQRYSSAETNYNDLVFEEPLGDLSTNHNAGTNMHLYYDIVVANSPDGSDITFSDTLTVYRELALGFTNWIEVWKYTFAEISPYLGGGTIPGAVGTKVGELKDSYPGGTGTTVVPSSITVTKDSDAYLIRMVRWLGPRYNFFGFDNWYSHTDFEASYTVGDALQISYAAHWDEYHSYQPNDGSDDLFFNLDTLWSDANIGFVGITGHWPLTDWRDQGDYDYSLATLMAGIEGGEHYDWTYESAADRDSQTRTNIVDVVGGKPWVFRYKDVVNWWANSHVSRFGGVEDDYPTAWVAGDKEIRYMGLGCGSIDKGANQADAEYNIRHTTPAKPYYSNGQRDFLIQRQYLEAMLDYWGDNATTGMLEDNEMFVSQWDARPYPAFPYNEWGDAGNWDFDRTLNGKVLPVYFSDIVTELAIAAGLTAGDLNLSALDNNPVLINGYTVGGIETARKSIEELMAPYHINAFESQGKVKFNRKVSPASVAKTLDDLTVDAEIGGYKLIDAQETDLPRELSLTFLDQSNDYQPMGVTVPYPDTASNRVVTKGYQILEDPAIVYNITEEILHDMRIAGEKITAHFDRSFLAQDPGDHFTITIKGQALEFRVDRMTIGKAIEVEGLRADASVFERQSVSDSLRNITYPGFSQYGKPIFEIMDVPLFETADSFSSAPRIAAFQDPWPNGVLVYDDIAGAYTINTTLPNPTLMGETVTVLDRGPLYLWDRGTTLRVKFYDSTSNILSRPEEQVLEGYNILLLETANGWEYIQFANAELVGTNEYDLTVLLRGQNGTEYAMVDSLAAGARVVYVEPPVNGIMQPLRIETPKLNLERDYRYGPNGFDIGDLRYTDVSFTAIGRPIMPWSPIHLALYDNSDASFTLTWIRRTRLNGDSWENPVPVEETTESYEIDILDDYGTAVRTIEVTDATTVDYTAAQQVEDFGAEQLSISFTVYQMSSVIGRGEGATYNG